MTMMLAAGGGGAMPIMVIALLGIGAQWLAWRLKVPSILLLLLAGFVAGPGMKLIGAGNSLDPDAIFGDLLLPLVGICVGLILYEGGLTLRFREIRGVGRTLTLLVTLGAAITCVFAAAFANVVLQIPVATAILLGAVLIVTGPTVIGPLLNHIRPAGQSGPLLKWEGIVIDPIGALTAVLVLEVILIGNPSEALGEVALAIVKTIVVGGGLGVACAAVLMFMMKRFWVPEALQNPVSLMLVIASYVLSNKIQAESGLLATTAMGMVLANQRSVEIRHILEFKENLRVLIISALFIVLAARISPEQLQGLPWGRVILFIAALLLIVRPASVFASTIGSELSWRERIFVALMAPRGIVAAAVASVFALTLEEASRQPGSAIPSGAELVPLTFAVIVGSVTFSGLLAPLAAKVLHISDSEPQGFVIVGASRLARTLAGILAKQGVKVLLVDTNRGNVSTAKMDGLTASYGNVLEESFFEELDTRGIGRAIALTPNAEVNTLALQRFERSFGKANVFRLPVRETKASEKKARDGDATEHGRRLFDDKTTIASLEQRLAQGWIVKSTTLSDEFDYTAYKTLYGLGALILFVINKDEEVIVATRERALSPTPGDTVIALIDPDQLFMGGPVVSPKSASAADAPINGD